MNHPLVTIHSCKQCGYKSSRESDIMIHIESVHKKQNFNSESLRCCYICGKPVDNLQQHVQSDHMQGNKNFYDCSMCDMSFSSKQYLKEHLQTMHLGKHTPKLVGTFTHLTRSTMRRVLRG